MSCIIISISNNQLDIIRLTLIIISEIHTRIKEVPLLLAEGVNC